MNRFDRVTAIFLQLQSRKVTTGFSLASKFEVSLRTIYRDIHTLQQAGVPIFGESGVGYSLPEDFLLQPVMLTREEVIALLTSEKVAGQFVDPLTANLAGEAVEKLRAVIRHTDREYFDRLNPNLQVLPTSSAKAQGSGALNVYHRLRKAIAARRLVLIEYTSASSDFQSEREVEPLGLFFRDHWHLVSFCRLRQDYRDFRLDRIVSVTSLEETFLTRLDSLQQYWEVRKSQEQLGECVVQFDPDLARRLSDSKFRYGWASERSSNGEAVEMTFANVYIPKLAEWLLPHAGNFAVISPPALEERLRELAASVHLHFGDS